MIEERKVFEVKGTPLTVEVTREPRGGDDGQDALDLRLHRGDTYIGSTQVFRGEGLDDSVFDGISEDERLQISGLLIAEWLVWPDTVNHLDESVVGTKRDSIDHLEVALAVAKRGLSEPRDPLFGGLS